MLDKALAVKTLAGCEKFLREWSEVARAAKDSQDDEGERFALSVADPLLDLRAVLTEHIETANRIAA